MNEDETIQEERKLDPYGEKFVGNEDLDIEEGTNEITIKSCIVDDKPDPLAIRPLVFGDNVIISVYDITLEKIGHEDSVGNTEGKNPDSYDMKKAANNNGNSNSASAYAGQWSYYLSNNGASAGCALKEANYDADTKTAVATYTKFSAGNVRLYYMPKEAAGTEVTITFKIAMNVDGTVQFKDGGAQAVDLTLTANEAQEVTLTVTVTEGQAVLLNPAVTNEEDIAEVTFTITEFTVTAA